MLGVWVGGGVMNRDVRVGCGGLLWVRWGLSRGVCGGERET